MKTSWVNLLSVFRKFKYATLLNITGFSVAFAAFIIIMMQLHHEYTFEAYHPNHPRIYRVERKYTDWSASIHPRPFIDAVIQSSPYIDAGSILFYANSMNRHFTIGDETDKTDFELPVNVCYPDITKIFHFEMVEGDVGCLKELGKALIPESMAKKLFGNKPATGQILRPLMFSDMVEVLKENTGVAYFEVGGVYKDFPENTQLNNSLYVDIYKENLDNWVNYNYTAYILLNDNARPEDVIDNFNQIFDFKEKNLGDSCSLGLTPIKDIYFQNNEDENLKTGSKEVSNMLFFIALLVIVIAAINYTNFCTSIAPMRIKSINTQKVLGASDFILRRTLLMETLSVCLISFFISLCIIFVFGKTNYITFIDTDLSFSTHFPVIVVTGIIAVLIGLIAGIYPAYFMTKYQPAVVLKGAFGLSPSGKRLRTGLVGFQFIISFALIIAALFIYMQNKYMKTFNLGFETDQVAVIFPGYNCIEHKDLFVNKLKENPGIEDVAFSMFKIGGTNNYMNWGGMKNRDKQFQSDILPVSWNFLDVLGIQYEGQKLTPVYELTDNNLYLIPNQKLKDELELGINEKIDVSWQPESQLEIVGFTNNINPKSLRYSIENVCFLLEKDFYKKYNPQCYSYIKIKTGSDVSEVVSHIRNTINELDPGFPVEVEFFDRIYDNLYKKEQNISQMIYLFSLLAVFMSIVGVFALVVFETQYRMKEIGIRKVHGASIGSILWMFNRHYLIILAVCFVIASPFAWYGVNEWLKGFAYKTPLYWWVYAIAFLVVTLITFLTVTYQSWQTAIKNPTESIKTE